MSKEKNIELENNLKTLRETTKQHKALDVKLSKSHLSMNIQEIQNSKSRLEALKKSMSSLVNTVEQFGGKWDAEAERAKL